MKMKMKIIKMKRKRKRKREPIIWSLYDGYIRKPRREEGFYASAFP